MRCALNEPGPLQGRRNLNVVGERANAKGSGLPAQGHVHGSQNTNQSRDLVADLRFGAVEDDRSWADDPHSPSKASSFRGAGMVW